MKKSKALIVGLFLSLLSYGQVGSKSMFGTLVWKPDTAFSNARVIVKYKGKIVAEIYKRDSLVVYDSLACIKGLFNAIFKKEEY